MRRRPLGTARDEELPVRLLADSDSLFITCQGVTLHYKLSLPGSSPLSLSSTTFLEPNSSCSMSSVAGGVIQFDRHLQSMSPKFQRQLYRSYSNQFHGSSLYAPLLDGPMTVTSPIPSEEIPVLHLDDIREEMQSSKLDSMCREKNVEGIGQFGIVLVHGFGGGVFSWRHVMGPLARQSNCTVAAFDRPGWGLTTRLRREDWEEKDLQNPYKLESQVITTYI